MHVSVTSPPLARRGASETRLRIRPRRHLQFVRGGGTQGGRRTVEVTDHRAKIDFVAFIKQLLEHVYPKARRIHLVLDNLSTQFRVCFEDVLVHQRGVSRSAS